MILPTPQNQTNCTDFSRLPAPPPTTALSYRILLTVFPILVTLFTIIGNAFVIIAIRANKRLARKRTSILILNLALADLLVGGGVMPFGISQIISENHWIFGRTLCRVWAGLDVICCTASIFTLCIISVDRFIGVTRPLGYSYIVTRGRLWGAVVAVWVLSIAVLLTTMQWADTTCTNVYVCRVGDELQYVIHSVIMSFFIPLTVILIVHYKIYQVTRRRELSLLHSSPECKNSITDPLASSPPKRHLSTAGYYYHMINTRRNAILGYQDPIDENQPINQDLLEAEEERRRSSGSTGSDRKFSFRAAIKKTTLRVHYGGHNDDVIKQRKFYSKHKKTAKTLALVVGAFLFCWLPFFVLYLISSTCENECIPPEAMEAFTWLGYSNSAFNPIIYAVSMKTFGGGVRQTLARIASLCSCSLWSLGRRRGRLGSMNRRQSRSPSAPNTAVVTECSILPLDGGAMNGTLGRQSITTIVVTGETAKRWPGTNEASLWMRQRAASLGASLRRVTKATRTKSQISTGGRSAIVIANEGAVDHVALPETPPDETVSPTRVADDELVPVMEDDLMYYVHNFGPNCEDDIEIENSVGVAAGRKDAPSETGPYMGCYGEELSWANFMNEKRLH